MKSIKRICAGARVYHCCMSWLARNWVAVRVSALYFVFGFALGTLGTYFFADLRGDLESYLTTGKQFEAFTELFATIGGALMGATVIVFAFVMFAMQINVERMPHGLFWKWSADKRLLGTFAATFIGAMLVSVCSLVPNEAWLATAVLIAGVGVLLIPCFFFYAYRLALRLVNPVVQLDMLVDDARRNLQTGMHSVDPPQLADFKQHPEWAAKAKIAIEHAASYARRYAERGDHEVMRVALQKIVEMNRVYVCVRGDTFSPDESATGTLFTNDGFINETNEHLRKNVQIGIFRRDEQQITQTLLAMSEICEVYLKMGYVRERAPKTHAYFSAQYLFDAVESIVSHDMSYVVVEGMQLMGQVGKNAIFAGQISVVGEASYSLNHIMRAKFDRQNDKWWVVKTGLEQFSNLLFSAIRSKPDDVSREIKVINLWVSRTFEMFLKTRKNSYFVRYCVEILYSRSGSTSQQNILVNLAKEISKRKAIDMHARTMARHVQQWADETQKNGDVLLGIIKQDVGTVFDIMNFVGRSTYALLIIANAPACDVSMRDEMEERACLLFDICVKISEKHKEDITISGALADEVFRVAVHACDQGCKKLTDRGCAMLWGWMLKVGVQGGNVNSEDMRMFALPFAFTISKLLVLDLLRENDGIRLFNRISKFLKFNSELSQTLRDNVAQIIRAETPVWFRHFSADPDINPIMEKVDQDKWHDNRKKIANLFSSHTDRST